MCSSPSRKLADRAGARRGEGPFFVKKLSKQPCPLLAPAVLTTSPLLAGDAIPHHQMFEGLTGLVQLNLSDNALTGPVPEDISQLTNLRVLKLTTNQFSGLLPVKVLANLRHNLRTLSLENNALVVTSGEAELLKRSLPHYVVLHLDPPDPHLKKFDDEAEAGPTAADARHEEEQRLLATLGEQQEQGPPAPVGEEGKAAEEREGEDKESGGGGSGSGGWAEAWDEEGYQYWYNDATGESTYENPTG